MNMKSNLPVLLILTIMLLVGLIACQSEEPDEVPETAVPDSPLAEANRQAVGGFSNVSAEGEVVPLRDAALSFQLGGHVAEILVDSGAEVSVGDPLIRLDAAPLENILRQAQAGLAAADAAQEAAEAQLAVAEAGRQRAEAGIKAAEAQKALIEAGPTLEEIAAAESNLAAAEGAIVQAAGNRDAAVNVSDAQVRAAEAQAASARADRDALKEAHDDIIDACFEKPGGGKYAPCTVR